WPYWGYGWGYDPWWPTYYSAPVYYDAYDDPYPYDDPPPPAYRRRIYRDYDRERDYDSDDDRQRDDGPRYHRQPASYSDVAYGSFESSYRREAQAAAADATYAGVTAPATGAKVTYISQDGPREIEQASAVTGKKRTSP